MPVPLSPQTTSNVNFLCLSSLKSDTATGTNRSPTLYFELAFKSMLANAALSYVDERPYRLGWSRKSQFKLLYPPHCDGVSLTQPT